MGRFIRFRTIRTKMLFGFSLVLLLVGILGVYNYLAVNHMSNNTRVIIEEDTPIVALAGDIAFNAAEMLATVRGYVLSEGDPEYVELFNRYLEEGKQFQEALLSLNASTEVNRLFEQKHEWETLVVNDVINEYQKGNIDTAMEKLTEMTTLSREVKNGFKNLAVEQQAQLMELGNTAIREGQQTLVFGIVVSVLLVVIGIATAIVTSNSISSPIKMIIERMRAIAAGDLSMEPLETKLIDETGQLCQATNEMSKDMRELLTEINRVSETVSSQSEELTQAASEVMAGSEQIAATMEELASGSEMQADHSGELSSLTSVFTSKVVEANENGHDVQQASNEVLQLTSDGYQLMETSRSQMNIVDEIVRDAVQKVQNLDKQSQRISELVSVIQTIADQTNLLALNAAIEAARAGEHGRGFSVVADEVRKLAEGVSVSVTDITDIVHSIQQETHIVTESLQDGYIQVEKGTEHMRTTGMTFGDITKAIEDVVQNINIVTTNLSDITNDSHEMNRSIQEIAAISEQSAAGIEETSASSQQTSSSMQEVSSSSNELASLANDLNELVHRFRI
ncbi:chemotaxis protein [Ammoniphilus oxalaticus]|uniref:Chemotaxis protein n=1 Tax=Ammoniphilus oxalaticus TaxID=66863 RepID=A0A419SNF4_9BACL|nr:methyl-accepting chemotaxis protein [Ammoniphilus oxalaticus]RKD25797.1 chemotaxis protein [Ammoniphilus oxalaticus]